MKRPNVGPAGVIGFVTVFALAVFTEMGLPLLLALSVVIGAGAALIDGWLEAA